MPSKSAKQARFMAAIAHSKSFARKAGVPQSVGREFHNADKRKKAKDGTMLTFRDALENRRMAQDARKEFKGLGGGNRSSNGEIGVAMHDRQIKDTGRSIAGKYSHTSPEYHRVEAEHHTKTAQEFRNYASSIKEAGHKSDIEKAASLHDRLANIHKGLHARKSGQVPTVRGSSRTQIHPALGNRRL